MKFVINEKDTLFYRVWEPPGEIAGKVVIVHGYAEHGGRYEYTANILAAAGFRVYAPDLPGHGRSDGKKGLVGDVDRIVEVLKNFVDFIGKEKGGSGIFLLGHSMGGALSLLYASRFGSDIRGVITSGAAVYPLPYPPLLIRKIISWISICLPAFKTVKLDAEKISTIPSVVESYRGDPLNYNGRIMAATASGLFRIRKMLEKKGPNISEPLLLLHGTDDRLASPFGSRKIFNICISSDKKIVLYEGARHEILNDFRKDEVLDEIKSWLLQRV